jgi:hypothetical protein
MRENVQLGHKHEPLLSDFTPYRMEGAMVFDFPFGDELLSQFGRVLADWATKHSPLPEGHTEPTCIWKKTR